HPQIKHKFIAGLCDSIPLDRIYRKSGTWKQWHYDSLMALGENPGQRFRKFLVELLAHSPSFFITFENCE
ncbi:MAG: hypothetical protein CVV03_12875, partial [Firmicutes bacterium HGW-Firmicutes-8]